MFKQSTGKSYLKKGDTVVVIAGKDKGKRGKITELLRKEMKVIVEGVNTVTRHTKPTQKSPQGGRVTKEGAIHISNVMMLDPKTNKPTRLGKKVTTAKNGKSTSVRVSKDSGAELN